MESVVPTFLTTVRKIHSFFNGTILTIFRKEFVVHEQRAKAMWTELEGIMSYAISRLAEPKFIQHMSEEDFGLIKKCFDVFDAIGESYCGMAKTLDEQIELTKKNMGKLNK